MKKDKQWLINELTKMNSVDNENQYVFGYETAIDLALDLADQLEEPGKVAIPQFVADEFDYKKRTCYQVDESKSVAHILRCAFGNGGKPSEFLDWVRENPEEYVMAVKNDYEVEKDPLYYVKLPDTNSEGEYLYLTKGKSTRGCWFNNRTEKLKYERISSQHKFTEAEIKAIDKRYWAFAVPVE